MRIPLWLMLALAATSSPIGARQSIEAHYDALFPRDCSGQEIPAAIRQQLKSRLRTEFRKVNPTIEAIGVLEVECALDSSKKLLGAIVLGYGTVADQNHAYEQFRKRNDIHELLANEQYGVFQYDPALTTLRKTITVFRSERWRDYDVNIELKSPTALSVEAKGSYGNVAVKREFNVAW
jgi:hypothetical protein